MEAPSDVKLACGKLVNTDQSLGKKFILNLLFKYCVFVPGNVWAKNPLLLVILILEYIIVQFSY